MVLIEVCATNLERNKKGPDPKTHTPHPTRRGAESCLPRGVWRAGVTAQRGPALLRALPSPPHSRRGPCATQLRMRPPSTHFCLAFMMGATGELGAQVSESLTRSTSPWRLRVSLLRPPYQVPDGVLKQQKSNFSQIRSQTFKVMVRARGSLLGPLCSGRRRPSPLCPHVAFPVCAHTPHASSYLYKDASHAGSGPHPHGLI